MVPLAVLLSLLVAEPQPAPSSETRPTIDAAPSAREWKLRLTLPTVSGQYQFLGPRSKDVSPPHYRPWAISLLVGSLACEFAHRWTAEAGGGLVYEQRPLAFVRGGGLLPFANAPAGSLNLQGLLSLAYRGHAHYRSLDATGRHTLSAEVGLAVDATHWWPSGWGLSLRVRTALARVLAASGPKLWDDPEDPGVTFQDDATWALDLGFDVALAWR
jgi:hypothetical protein